MEGERVSQDDLVVFGRRTYHVVMRCWVLDEGKSLDDDEGE